MPIRRSVQAYRAATPIEQAACMLAVIPAAVAVPALLGWVIRGIADAGRGEGTYPAAAARLAVDAMGALVQWIGLGVLAGLAVLCAFMAAVYLKDPRRSRDIPAWAVAQTWALAAVAALGGLFWLA